MPILLAFLPFIVFAAIDRLVGATPALVAGAVTSAALIFRDCVMLARSPKILEVGTVILFGGLALYSFVTKPIWSLWGVRLCVDLGLLAIVLVSLAVRRPFTLQYAREQVSAEMWSRPEFLRTNDVITAVWALAFATMVAADLLLIYRPDTHPRAGIIITVLAIVGAVKFTSWYPARSRPRP